MSNWIKVQNQLINTDHLATITKGVESDGDREYHFVRFYFAESAAAPISPEDPDYAGLPHFIQVDWENKTKRYEAWDRVLVALDPATIVQPRFRRGMTKVGAV